MLLPEHVVALNDVIAALLDAEALYLELARDLEGPITASLTRLAEARAGMRGDLELLVRELGELPESSGTPGSEVGRTASRVTTAISADAAAAAREAVASSEEELRARVQAALEQEQPPDAQALLERLREELAAATPG